DELEPSVAAPGQRGQVADVVAEAGEPSVAVVAFAGAALEEADEAAVGLLDHEALLRDRHRGIVAAVSLVVAEIESRAVRLPELQHSVREDLDPSLVGMRPARPEDPVPSRLDVRAVVAPREGPAPPQAGDRDVGLVEVRVAGHDADRLADAL